MENGYAVRCRTRRDNKHAEMELELKRQAIKPIVLFETDELDVKSVKPKAKSKRVVKQLGTGPPEIRVVPIPLIDWDGDDESSQSSSTVPKTPKKGAFDKLDLPLVLHNLKSDCLKGIMKNKCQADRIKCKRRIKKTTTEQNGTHLEDMMSGLKIDTAAKASSDSPSFFKNINTDTDVLDEYIDNLISATRKQDTESLSRMASSPNGKGEFSVPKGVTIRPRIDRSVEVDPLKVHVDLLKLAIKLDSTDYESAMTGTESPRKSNWMNTVLQITTALKLKDVAELSNFQIYPKTPILKSLRYNLCSNMFPDAMKHFAFSYWQRGELEKCVYILSEAHGSYLRTEILDKHNQYFGRPDEYVPSSIKLEPKLEQIKLEKFRQQSDDLVAPGKGLASFSEHLDKLDPDWNIIQLTSMFHVHNRFSNSGASYAQTPALFLTCFSKLPGSRKRNSFVTYIREPVIIPGVSNVGIISEFKKVMLKNRSINEKYVGDRRKYWEVREEHNTDVRNILKAVQENWLSPWYFLLPGNVKDEGIQKKIHSFVLAVELVIPKKLTSYQKVAFYKLVENYSFLCKSLRDVVLLDLVSYILDVPKKGLRKITEKLIDIGSTISKDTQRHPTILILDQGIEQLPWDWLKCLRTTTVTRVQSISVMYSLMNMVKTISPVDPSQAIFVLNPDGSLNNVQVRLEEYFNSRNTWKGHVGKKPSYKDLDSALQNESVFLYCGHGSGQFLFPDHLLQKIYCRAIPILMGCGSAQYKYYGPKAYATSIVNAYFTAACPSVVGFLYEVTDVECDRLTVELLEHWTPGNGPIPAMASFDNISTRSQVNCLATAVRLSRKGATQFLTQAGIVNYGLPIQKADDGDATFTD